MAVNLGISFGAFLLFPDQRLLLKEGKPIQLGSRALEILIALVEHPGDLVSKDDLLRRVWPNTFVDEGSLRVHMSALRRALGEGRGGGRYIVNIPGLGYRFVADISAAEGTSAIPPLEDVRSNLPLPLARVIGRADASETLSKQVPRRRFVTIVGPGGVGKTTLALAVANDLKASYADGVRYVDLGALSAPHHVSSAIASALDLEISTENPTLALAAFMRDKRLLLVLDSCDYVIDTVAHLAADLLARASNLNILTTSREPLRTAGEYLYRLSPLEVPPASSELGAEQGLSFPSIELFVERVMSNVDGYQFTDQDAPKVAEICRKLDGLPLAIELAAARVDVFGISRLAELLENQLPVLTRGLRTAQPRHQTLSATLDWSYSHLPEPEQILLNRLSLFASRFTLEAATAVAAGEALGATDIAEGIANLVAKSLIVADVRNEAVHFRLLESTRAYANAKLKSGEGFNRLSRLHAEYVRAQVESALALLGKQPAQSWLASSSLVLDDVRVALGWAFSPDGDERIGIALTVATFPLWVQLSLMEEARRWLEQAIASTQGTDIDSSTSLQLHASLGSALLYTKGPGPEIETAWTRALEFATKLFDTKQQLTALWGLLTNRLNNYQLQEGLTLAEKFREVAEHSSDPNDVLVGERLIGGTLFFMGDFVEARKRLEFMLAQYVAPSLPSPVIHYQFEQTVRAKSTLAEILWMQGFPDQAKRLAEENVERAKAFGHDLSLCTALGQGSCPIALRIGDLPAARSFTELLLDVSARRGLSRWHAWGRCFHGAVKVAEGNTGDGIQLLRLALAEYPDTVFALRYLEFLGYLADGLGKSGQVAEGIAVIDNAITRSDRNDERWCIAELLRIKADLAAQQRFSSASIAEDFFEKSLDSARRQQARSWELRTALNVARLFRDTERSQISRELLATAYGGFTEGFETADLKAAKELLGELA